MLVQWTGWLIVVCLGQLLDECLAKGRSSVRFEQPSATTPVYPSTLRRRYYTYYISYFTPTGFYYAQTAQDKERTKSTCENYEPFFDNATTLGTFPCPMGTDPDDFTHCCGESRYQYCCRLVDTQNFQLAVGLGVVGALGLIIAVIVCICLSLKHNQKAAKAKKDIKRQMVQAGIPKYENKSTGRYSASQSEDGYMVVVRFKKLSFYDEVWANLRNRYAALAWRNHDNKKEVKVTFEDGSWVNLVLQDLVQGKPQLTVVREKAAVEWMETTYEEICTQIPDDSGLCSCLSSKQKQVHPVQAGSSHSHKGSNNSAGQRHNKYQMNKSKSDLKDKKDKKANPKY